MTYARTPVTAPIVAAGMIGALGTGRTGGVHMGTTNKDPDRLQRAIRNTQGELESSLAELKGVMNESLDWRTWVRRHPLPAIGVAALIGVRLGRGRWL
jgi:hypothetical protein